MKYKKCCGIGGVVARGGVLKPRYEPGAERDPAYWRALKAARNRFVFPDVAWEDPRTTAAMLGLPQRPGFDARRPPLDEDFDWLVAQLERRAQGGAAGVSLRRDRFGDEVVFAFPLDRTLTAAIKRLPGRRFDATERTWVVPASPRLAASLGSLIDEHPWLTITEELADWLDAHAGAWSAVGTIVEHGFSRAAR